MVTRPAVAVGIAFISLLLSGCGGDSSDSQPSATTGAATTASPQAAGATGATEPTSEADQATGTTSEAAGPAETAEPIEPTEATQATEPSPTTSVDLTQTHPDVVSAALTRTADNTYTVSATLSSPYDTPERYADAWRVLHPNGTELGVRELGHDHQNEQPFTRTLSDVLIPAGVVEVTIEGRDQANGWGGATFTIAVP